MGGTASSEAGATDGCDDDTLSPRTSALRKRMRKELSWDGGAGVPVSVMLPLDTVTPDGKLRDPVRLKERLEVLKGMGVAGVMVDVWWGIVEAQGPRNYNWQPYVELMELCQSLELTVEAVMSFHACGGNVGDTVNVPLPLWVVKAASAGGLFFTDQAGFVNLECLSLFSDEVPGLEGRTPVDCYHDFMVAFVSAMDAFMGNTLVLVCVGMGPCGELRYPSYPMQDSRWRFPGVGEFQSFDKHAATQLAEAAGQCGHPEWGRKPGPHDAGGYTSKPEDTGFFCSGGSMHGEYGQFFLKWYSGALVAHGRRMLEAASRAFGSCASGGRRVPLGVKLAGIHWHYLGSHAAELTAGYYNVLGHNGYQPVADLCGQFGAGLVLTCIEMRDSEQPPEALSSPERLMLQVRECAARARVPLMGENALFRSDAEAFDTIILHARLGRSSVEDAGQGGKPPLPPMASVTFLRMQDGLLDDEAAVANFARFVHHMGPGPQFVGPRPAAAVPLRSMESAGSLTQLEALHSHALHPSSSMGSFSHGTSHYGGSPVPSPGPGGGGASAGAGVMMPSLFGGPGGSGTFNSGGGAGGGGNGEGGNDRGGGSNGGGNGGGGGAGAGQFPAGGGQFPAWG